MNAITRLRQGDAWIPWAFVAFFAIVVAVNGVMVAFALGSFTGLTNDNAYRRGLEYNRLLDEARAQHALGWHVAAGVEPVADGAALTVSVRDGHDIAISDALVTAILSRPTEAGLDVEAVLAPAGGGVYRAAVALPKKGLWDLRLQVTHGDDEHRSARRISLP